MKKIEAIIQPHKLDEVRDAQRYMEENRNFGKIVLAVTPDA